MQIEISEELLELLKEAVLDEKEAETSKNDWENAYGRDIRKVKSAHNDLMFWERELDETIKAIGTYIFFEYKKMTQNGSGEGSENEA